MIFKCGTRERKLDIFYCRVGKVLFYLQAKGKYTRYDFLYDFCRIRRVVPCIHSKSYKKLSYQRIAHDKKKVKHV